MRVRDSCRLVTALAKAAVAGPAVVAGGEPGAGQLAFSPHHRGQVSSRAGVEQARQFAGGGGVVQVVGGAGGQGQRGQSALIPKVLVWDRWRATNAPYLVTLVRAGATLIDGKLAGRPAEGAEPEAA